MKTTKMKIYIKKNEIKQHIISTLYNEQLKFQLWHLNKEADEI